LTKLTNTQREKALAFVNNRRVFGGPTNDLMMIQPVKHTWARQIWLKMLENTWFPNEVDLSADAKQFPNLLDEEREAYLDVLAFLSNLDGIQVNNLTRNIGLHITSPEASMTITRQAFEEALHVESYSQMIESLPGVDPLEVYNRFETDEVMAAKNQYVMRSSYVLRDQGYSDEGMVLAIVANIALEGIYFYSGFLFFYNLARMGKMKETSKMIKFIQRDEMCHLDFFVNMWHATRRERPELFTAELMEKVEDVIRGAVEHETLWGKHVIRHGVMGLTEQIIEDFVRFLGDRNMKNMGLKPIYNVENPVKWFDDYAQVENTDENYFESKVSAYEVGSLEWD